MEVLRDPREKIKDFSGHIIDVYDFVHHYVLPLRQSTTVLRNKNLVRLALAKYRFENGYQCRIEEEYPPGLTSAVIYLLQEEYGG
ncbi:MAG: hypothetical protein Q8Q18_03085 [bacterium]|nr:hypothetical protein [bacterium]